MSRREFQFSDGSSNKFWTIEVKGTSQTVHFGKAGTTGQSQTKEFASEAEAVKASDKLIAEKTKKGYAEVKNATTSAGTPTPKVKKVEDVAESKKPKAKSTEVAEPETIAAMPPPNLPAAAVTRTIDLEAEYFQKAEWPKRWRPQTRPEARAYDLNQCVLALSGVEMNQYGRWNHTWPTTCIPLGMTPQEAHFWFLALIESTKQDKLKPANVARRSPRKSPPEK